MRKIGFAVLYTAVIGIIVAFILTSCKEKTEFYNIFYHYNGGTIEYYDVTNLHCYNNHIYFTSCDGATIFLSDGAIEIIPIDVD